AGGRGGARVLQPGPCGRVRQDRFLGHRRRHLRDREDRQTAGTRGLEARLRHEETRRRDPGGSTMKRYQLRIAGQWVDPAGGEWFESQNPFTGEAWAEIPRCDARDVDRAVQAAHAALTEGPWAEMTASQRGLLLHRLGDLIARDANKLAATEVRDNGKLIAEMQGQLNYVPQWYYYFGGLADKIEGAALPLDKKGYFAFTRKEPVGVVAAITPWNSPLL